MADGAEEQAPVSDEKYARAGIDPNEHVGLWFAVLPPSEHHKTNMMQFRCNHRSQPCLWDCGTVLSVLMHA